ncbi:MAG: hypothetical protein A3A24_01780 [Candidatus Buchananbacteria bacterium RIFCSPLOWO2_01_FULL_46_12]|uniref:Ferredoxin n=1 Tax=Candidatus Buchananbacteria bacterium RIFCSPLOWO2_01_FULL_46_12 TaxID=1797546 RepID=A0A1G1YRK9_9BACT|nr:MAG: hypothetical protein A3A24_01780 [Candidatus Buchananbacteria bacterium RIFCSPLOWO2_01_FULL_46_12]
MANLKKLVLAKNKCVGCGACVGICQAVFRLDENGLAALKPLDDYSQTESAIQEAMAACPTQAISWEK